MVRRGQGQRRFLPCYQGKLLPSPRCSLWRREGAAKAAELGGESMIRLLIPGVLVVKAAGIEETVGHN